MQFEHNLISLHCFISRSIQRTMYRGVSKKRMKKRTPMLTIPIRPVSAEWVIWPRQRQITDVGRRKAKNLRIDKLSDCHMEQMYHTFFWWILTIIMITRLCLSILKTCLHAGTYIPLPSVLFRSWSKNENGSISFAPFFKSFIFRLAYCTRTFEIVSIFRSYWLCYFRTILSFSPTMFFLF